MCSLGAAALIAFAAFQPLWRLELVAPQYPKGLFITAYGYDMRGDVQEINALNHYVGLRAVDPRTVIELDLFPWAVAAMVALLVVGAFLFRGRLRLLSALAAWSLPVFMLADLQYWLHTYGHNINPDAALDLPPFTPKVIGTTQVMNFHSITTVTWAFWLLVAAALLVSAAPPFLRWLRASWANTGQSARAGASMAALALLLPALAGHALAPRAAAADSVAAAIARAEPGATVTIPSGVYRERLVIDKPITLIGAGAPVIDAGGAGDVILITAEGVTVRGFVVQGSGRSVSDEPAAIRIRANRATIEDNRIRDALYGITVEESNGHVLRGNQIEGILDFPAERRGHGFYLHYSTDNLIEGNELRQVKDGILLTFTERTAIRHNTVTHVRYGIHYMYAKFIDMEDNIFTENITGGVLMYSNDITMTRNEFSHNRSAASGYGLAFKDVDNILLVDNMIHHNNMGLALEGSPFTPGAYVTVRDNFVSLNRVAVGMFTTTNVGFSGNTFAGNLRQVEAASGNLESKNQWSDAGRGNYWDDYQGYDADGDGVGDLTYRYAGTFAALVEKNAALRAYDFTLARTALDMAARWFPTQRPVVRASDAHPLMAPTRTLPRQAGGGVRAAAAGVMAALTAVPLAVFWLSMGAPARRWRRC
ncbi:MAG: nitrous oxide reductase family maturation protein NosD [Dehalococcoidia bacterium]